MAGDGDKAKSGVARRKAAWGRGSEGVRNGDWGTRSEEVESIAGSGRRQERRRGVRGGVWCAYTRAGAER